MMGYRVVFFTVCSRLQGGLFHCVQQVSYYGLYIIGWSFQTGFTVCSRCGRWSYYNRVVFLDRYQLLGPLQEDGLIGLFRQVSLHFTVRTICLYRKMALLYRVVFLDSQLYHCPILAIYHVLSLPPPFSGSNSVGSLPVSRTSSTSSPPPYDPHLTSFGDPARSLWIPGHGQEMFTQQLGQLTNHNFDSVWSYLTQQSCPGGIYRGGWSGMLSVQLTLQFWLHHTSLCLPTHKLLLKRTD